MAGGEQHMRGGALGFFAAFTLVALVGYGIFGLHPEYLAGLGPLQSFYGVAFSLFARAHVLVGAAVLGWMLFRSARWAWVPAAIGVVLLSLMAELLGTGTGLPFGAYRYSGLLGWKVAGHVPILVPLSWCLMAIPAFLLADWSAGDRRPLARWFLAALGLVAWDLALDPAMSRLAPYWIWEQPGPYYGMPWVNLAGWFVTALAIMAFLHALRVEQWGRRISSGWLAWYYAVTLAMPLGMVMAAGLWGAWVTTVLAVATLAAIGVAMRASDSDVASAPKGRSGSTDRPDSSVWAGVR